MLFHGALGHASGTYHDVFSAHLKTPINFAKFEKAIDGIAQRHPALRASFHITGFTVPIQLVHKASRVPVYYEDLRAVSFNEQERILTAWKAEEKTLSFAIDAPPLLRFYYHRRTEDSFQFTISFHHAILDGWSVASMISELFTDYFALLDEVPPSNS
ncbi:MAG: hypothetical protein DMG70_06535, partial [Acidobacteria bacterium]